MAHSWCGWLQDLAAAPAGVLWAEPALSLSVMTGGTSGSLLVGGLAPPTPSPTKGRRCSGGVQVLVGAGYQVWWGIVALGGCRSQLRLLANMAVQESLWRATCLGGWVGGASL